jgi:hypothetical protein
LSRKEGDVFNRALDVLGRLPRGLLTLHILAKFVAGVGVGILLNHYMDFDGGLVGWFFIIAAFVIAIPSTIRILSGLTKP